MADRVLILTAGYGEGHNSAARGIRDALAATAPDVRVEVHDMFAETYGVVHDSVRAAYLRVINQTPFVWSRVYRWLDRKRDFRRSFRLFIPLKRRLRGLIAERQPDVIVSVFPAYIHMLDELLGPATGATPTRVVMITDSVTVNAIWHRGTADHYIVANEQTADVLRSARIARGEIHTLGFPVHPRFAEMQRRHDPPNDGNWRVLLMMNAQTRNALPLVRELTALRGVNLTITTGRSARLRRNVEAIASRTSNNVHVTGWTHELPELLARSHIVIGKAGGATVQEAIAAACPMIINQVVPGQEEGNAQLIVENGAGALALNPRVAAATLQRAIADDGKVWRDWRTNIARMSRPGAALEIARFIRAL